MLSEKETLLLKHLRQNARKSLAKISRETNIPVSTLFELLKKLESKVITKHVSLLDFLSMGYSLRVSFIISSKLKQELKEFLLKEPSVNSLSSLINESDFYAECVFRDLKEMTKFKEQLEKFEIGELKEYFIVDDIKQEGFEFCTS